jgi:hemoglobin
MKSNESLIAGGVANPATLFVSWCFRGSIVIAFLLAAGCGNPEKKQRDFHTSGSVEADQRAEQRVAKQQQIRGESGATTDKKKGDNKDEGKRSLYERLGGDAGLTLIVEDWVNRAIVDPRVNWIRKGVTSGNWYDFKKRRNVEWHNTPEAGTRMKAHIKQFLAVATGGPPKYEGNPMTDVHKPMNISNAEFDAAVGDLSASLENLKVPTQEQKELLAAIETTRPQVVSKR